ncbi:MAG: hypothetical protein AMJ95_08990 [Omnitrophica WOR_2 bacterium SM23_72]|nr:MAG: hypothetical protein AMJ95_08990 [Omnitrophica WOR_2 bacterium SM23_72]
MSAFERLVFGLMAVPRLPVILLLCLLGICVGLFLALRPASCIELQKRFYERINWRMEPISLEKEIRYTRLLGWFSITLFLAFLILVFLKPDLL